MVNAEAVKTNDAKVTESGRQKPSIRKPSYLSHDSAYDLLSFTLVYPISYNLPYTIQRVSYSVSLA